VRLWGGDKDRADLRSVLCRPQGLTEEERTSKGKLDALIKGYNRAVPELRLQISDEQIPLNLRICADYYFKCEQARLEEDAASKVAELLNSFLENHPLEWSISYWKNDFIAELVLGKLNTFPGARKEDGQRWLKGYWRRQQRMQREINTHVSPKRVAASSAVFDLELLELIDKHPQLFIRPGFRLHAAFVNWLNRNWKRLSAKKSGVALLNCVVSEYRSGKIHNKGQELAFSDSELVEICDAYGRIEFLYDPGKVPPYQVILTSLARKHKVSARLVTKVRAEINKERRKLEEHPKARS
jgi:hypothetical protein